MRSMVEGASDSTLRCCRKWIVESRAPSTALRAVPPPRYRGAGCARLDLPERRGFNPAQIKRAHYAPRRG